MGARMIDIARDLGVSLMTVSKALRSHSDISEQTRMRVMKRARELDYRPNWIARSLITRRTYVIGLVIPWFPPAAAKPPAIKVSTESQDPRKY